MYRHLYNAKGFKAVLPEHFKTSPNNPLLIELKNLSPYSDPINISSESTRDLCYLNSSLLNSALTYYFSNKLSPSELPLNLNLLNKYLLSYVFGNSTFANLPENTDAYKNQYRPMKKGVSNMIKLHATGAIAMPIEVRLHILASSKDVIHSWAIPSAGVKIDCVPGYSSHRIMIFLVSGIF